MTALTPVYGVVTPYVYGIHCFIQCPFVLIRTYRVVVIDTQYLLGCEKCVSIFYDINV